MAITLRADNKSRGLNEGFSYISDHYPSGTLTFVVTNSDDFKANDPVLIGDWGNERAETSIVESVENSTNTITLKDGLGFKFSHSESTKVTIIRYDKARFYLTPTPGFSSDNPLRIWQKTGDDTTEITTDDMGGDVMRYIWNGDGRNPLWESYMEQELPAYTHQVKISGTDLSGENEGTFDIIGYGNVAGKCYFEISNPSGTEESGIPIGGGLVEIYTSHIDIDADNFYTQYVDYVNSAGFGFYSWRNTMDNTQTNVLSPIPYGGWPVNSAKSIIDDFFSTLNSRELKLITRKDAFNWLNEGYAIMVNELNLVNPEYSSPAVYDLTTASGTSEYTLPSNFSNIVSIFDAGENARVEKIDLNDVETYVSRGNTAPRYYIRSTWDSEATGEVFIGIVPTPSTSSQTFNIRYNRKTSPINKNYDHVFVPDNNFYCLKDFMLYRASPKINRSSGTEYFQLFLESIKRMKITSFKKDNRKDCWTAARNTIV